MEKLRFEEAISFPEHSQSFLELTTECRSVPQSCSANTARFLSVPIVFCTSVFLFSDSSSDSFLSLTSVQCTWVSHCSRQDSSSIRQQSVFMCVLTVLSRLGPLDSCSPVVHEQLQGAWQRSWASASSCAWVSPLAGVLVTVHCRCPGRSSSAARTVTGRWWVQRPI